MSYIAAISAEQAPNIAVLGLGYVGLPLAIAFNSALPTLGFDINASRVAELAEGRDSTEELNAEELVQLAKLRVSSDPAELRGANVYIVAVPTPVDADMRPDLSPLLKASAMVATVLQPGDLVIYESTVFPGCTESDCVPVLERGSGLRLNQDFFVGYSPERINPGDQQRRLRDIVKLTSGSTPKAAAVVDALYQRIIHAGTYLAPDIRTAEAAKLIENTQRDMSIAIVNEFAMIFNRLGLDSDAVLKAAATKWNFIAMKPGLVGGHCIGVDPYYLIQCARRAGINPLLTATARQINEHMPQYIADEILRLAARKRVQLNGAKALVLGVTFKENCPDLRNTKVIDLVRALEDYGCQVDLHDPCADSLELRHEYGRDLTSAPSLASYDVLVVAVAHRQYSEWGSAGLRAFGRPGHMLYDVKRVLPAHESDGSL